MRLVLPWTPESPISLYNLIPIPGIAESSSAYAPQDWNEKHAEPVPIVSSHIDQAPSKSTSANLGDQTNIFASQQEPFIASHESEAFTLTGIEWIALIWFLGSLIMLILILGGHLRFGFRLKDAAPVTIPHISQLFQTCLQMMRIRRPIKLMVSSRVRTPTLYGVMRPRLLMPAAYLDSYSDQEMSYIFMHELAHDKRKDIAVNWIMTILLSVHWFNPLLWIAYYLLREDQELACDALTLSHLAPGESSEYARTIIKQLERRFSISSSPAAAGFAGGKSQLKRRIRFIAWFNRSPYRWSLLGLGLVIVIAAVTLTGALDQNEDQAMTLVGSLTDGESFRFRGYEFGQPLEEILELEGWTREDLIELAPTLMGYEQPIVYEEVGLTIDRVNLYLYDDPPRFVAGEYYAQFDDEQKYLETVEKVIHAFSESFRHLQSSNLENFNPLPQSSDEIVWHAEDSSKLHLSVYVNYGQFDHSPDPYYILNISPSGPTKQKVDDHTIIELGLTENRLVSHEFHVTLKYPKEWKLDERKHGRFEGEDGFLMLGAAKGGSLDEVVEREMNHHLKPYGEAPQVEKLTISGNSARMILPSEDQHEEWKGHSTLIVQYPRNINISDEYYEYFLLYADQDHIHEIAASLIINILGSDNPLDQFTI